MIIKNKQGCDILNGGEKRIAFAVNIEGYNDAGFAGMISRKYWPDLANFGPCDLGTVLSKHANDITFYALVCHSLKKGWFDQTEIIKTCFDNIKSDEPIATISIGTGLIGMLSGADFKKIKKGMELSNKKIILY